MEFDMTKVFTALNADEVKVGSKGYGSNTIKGLMVEVDNSLGNDYGEIYDIKDSSFSNRFFIKKRGGFNLFYLVEEPAKKEYRSYNDMNEMIEDFEKRFYLVPQVLNLSQVLRLPQIWVKGKHEGKCKDEIVQVVGFYKDLVTICHAYDVNEFTLYELFDHFTYLDGSPCGIKED